MSAASSEKEPLSAGGVATAGIIGLLGTWHLALATATPGHGFTELTATLRALIAGQPLEPETATGPANMLVLVAVIIGVVVLAITLTALWVARPRKHAGNGLASASDITKSVKETYRQEIGRDGRKPVCVRSEDAGLMIAPPRAGKTTTLVVSRVLDAPGACVCTSTKAEVLRLTHLLRAKKGRIWAFDPEGTSQWPHVMQWDIVAGCQDPVEATERARGMVKAVDVGEGGNIEFFQRAAQGVISCYLHAAALAGLSADRVQSWAKNTRDEEPYRILEDHPLAAPSWGDELAQYTRGEAGATIQSVMMTVNNVLSVLRTGSALKSVMPGPNLFDIDAFLDSADTLYLLSESGDGSAAPLTTALVTALERRASIKSQHTVEGRFTVPLTLVLDEAPNIAALPSLPKLMTDSGGRGIIVWAISQSFAQLEGRWGSTGARTMLNGAAVLLVLGGIKEVELLEMLSRLSGERRVERKTRSHSYEGGQSTSVSSEWEQNLRLDDIRQLDLGQALMWYLNKPPARVTMTPWWQRKDAKLIRESLEMAGQVERAALAAGTVTDVNQ